MGATFCQISFFSFLLTVCILTMAYLHNFCVQKLCWNTTNSHYWKWQPVNQKLITAIVNSTLRNIISFLNLLVCIWALISKLFAFRVELLVFVSLLISSGMKSHQQGSTEANLQSGWMGSEQLGLNELSQGFRSEFNSEHLAWDKSSLLHFHEHI